MATSGDTLSRVGTSRRLPEILVGGWLLRDDPAAQPQRCSSHALRHDVEREEKAQRESSFADWRWLRAEIRCRVWGLLAGCPHE